MKKIVLLVIVITLLASTGAFAATSGFGIGVEWSAGLLGGLPNSALVTIKAHQLPFVLGIGAQIGARTFNLGATLDWWLYQTHLIGALDLYVGPGLYLGVGNGYFALGGRIPVGLQIWPIGKVLELFLEIAPAMEFVGPGQISFPNLDLQAGVGFRFWF